LSFHARGFIPVTGPTGSGKSTTLAALAWNLVKERAVHVVMIEDPTEYEIPHGIGHVTQRTVGLDVASFEEGVHEALRQDPDVIIVGEMRRLETIRAALTAAETGHLVLGTLHTTTAHRTVDRIINPFPASEQAYIRSVLGESLLGVVCQQLLSKADDSGVVAAFEFLRATSAIQNHIREGDTHKIVSAMQTGGRLGMRLLDADLARLVREGAVDVKDAIKKANDPQELIKSLNDNAEIGAA
jgi:twitching motility protein PilT